MFNFIINEGDILKIRSDLRKGMLDTIYGVNEVMETRAGERLVVEEVNEYDPVIRFKDTGWNWSRQMIEEIIKGTKNEQEVEETRDYLDFERHDEVVIRNKEELEKIYGRNKYGIKTYIPFTKEMEELCGRRAIVTKQYGKFVELDFRGKEQVSQCFTFTTDMIEIFRRKDEGKTDATRTESSEETEGIIEEMISKVDVKKFKKILASAFEVPATKLKGVDRILRYWANAKKDLYKLLGNEIKVSKEIEYNADKEYWREQIRKFAQEFPGIGYMLLNMNIDAFVENKYIRFSADIDRLMSDAKEGMKLTTFLSNAFNNADFDTALSKVIDTGKVSGNIVISIDPVDFLTMSFNQSGWCSCHTISHNGCSRNFGEFVRRHI